MKIVLKTLLIRVLFGAILMSIVYFIVPYILPFFIKVGDHLILDNFNLFLILLAIDVPVMFLGYPYLGVLNNKIKYVNLSAITASVFHLMSATGLLKIHSHLPFLKRQNTYTLHRIQKW
jgi:Na+-driven multidrug efflux pump